MSGAVVSNLYLIAGLGLLMLVVVDLLWTTLWADGAAGPFAARFTSLLWRGMRRIGGPRTRSLSLAGPVILTATLLAWVALLWVGWTLVFAVDASTLIDTRNGGPVSWIDRQYFVAYSMFTMGNGDFSPRDGWPQVATSFTTASGMLFVTLGVSYVLNVLTAVNQKRAFASSVWGLGSSGEQVLVTGWNGRDLRDLDLPLNTLASQLSMLADQHKAYPILHYYHSERIENASVMAVAIINEALTLSTAVIADEYRPNAAVLRSLRSSVDSYLHTLASAFIQPADEPPPDPDVDRLCASGIPALPEGELRERLAEHRERRRMLLGVVHADAWWWPTGRHEPRG
jgi:hypothetical protein